MTDHAWRVDVAADLGARRMHWLTIGFCATYAAALARVRSRGPCARVVRVSDQETVAAEYALFRFRRTDV